MFAPVVVNLSPSVVFAAANRAANALRSLLSLEFSFTNLATRAEQLLALTSKQRVSRSAFFQPGWLSFFASSAQIFEAALARAAETGALAGSLVGKFSAANDAGAIALGWVTARVDENR